MDGQSKAWKQSSEKISVTLDALRGILSLKTAPSAVFVSTSPETSRESRLAPRFFEPFGSTMKVGLLWHCAEIQLRPLLMEVGFKRL